MEQWGSTIFTQVPGPATVRSFAWAIDPWNARTVSRTPERGMTPVAENRGTFESFHVKNPDGWNLQVCNREGLVKARKSPSTASCPNRRPSPQPTAARPGTLGQSSLRRRISSRQDRDVVLCHTRAPGDVLA